jgi:hypothetical protein
LTSEERKAVGADWLEIGSLMGKNFSNRAWSMMLNAIDDLPASKVLAVLGGWLGGKNAKQFPMPYDIRQLIAPDPDDENIARESASRVIAAVSKFGYMQAVAAREWVGELGWIAVERAGGWTFVCENLGTRHLPATTFSAQVRDLIGAQVQLAKAGRLDQPVQIPAPNEFAERLTPLLNVKPVDPEESRREP